MSQRRGGLGRGLESLIPTEHTADDTGFAILAVDDIEANDQQPRVRFDQATLDQLAASIREVGILQPIAVMRIEDSDRYRIINGERRWRAARQAGLHEVPAVIRTVDDERMLTEALIENLQREDLTPLEEGAAYKALLEEYGLTHEQVADRVGKSRSAVTNAIRLLGLPAKIQALLETGELRQGHARALLGLEDRTYAVHIARRAVDDGWSVRQVEDAVRQRQENPSEARRPVVKEVRPVEIIELEQRLTEALGTRVSIAYRKKKGRVQIDFASLDELERIYRTIFG
ncbi:MAG: ParB/RepB/Spo0J family partition protein [Acidimicrobiia bacterium]|nr:ParB/RepB/Spo0J family partition protein [Acidimicrobiia bacterium]